MFDFKTDLHIHTVLSPCGDLDMSPVNLVKSAASKGLDIIGVTDHNTTRHCKLVEELGKEKGIFVLTGAEVNSREEIHSLAFFENHELLAKFQQFIDQWLVPFKNDPAKFGYQVQVDREEQIVYEENRSLFATLDRSVEQVEEKVHELDGIFILAHVDRPRNSVYSQLGFIPEGLTPDGVEISWASDPDDYLREHPELDNFTLVRSSDAHCPGDIGRAHSIFSLRNRSFAEIKMAFEKLAGREVIAK